MGVLRNIHTAIKAWFLKEFRTREVTRAFRIAHAVELSQTPFQQMPIVRARQEQEMVAVRAGQLQIVDRKSWQWPFLPASVTRLAMPIIKSTPYNLRRMSRTPVPRRAINLIKGSLITLQWAVESIDGVEPSDGEDGQKKRIKIAEQMFNHPNNQDSFQTFLEQGVEDMLILGGFVAEMRFTMDPERPIKMWAVNVESIRIFPAWSETVSEDMPHYAQMTGLKGERGAVLFYDDEMMYLKDNPSTDNPFGLGKMEVAFLAINDFLGIQRMSGMAGADQVHKTWLWWEQPQSDSAYQIVRRHIQNELEGQAKISLIGGMKKPEVIEVTPVTEEDLLLNWQQLLIRMIALGFDMSALSFLEQDINRAVGQVLDDKDFRSAVVPMAMRIQEAFTRKILHDKLNWYDLQLKFLNLDDPDKVTMTDILARMYSANAVTPNEWRKKLGYEKLVSPFADLTQFECMLLNIQAMADMQNQNAEKAADRQSQMMDKMQQEMGDQEDQGDSATGVEDDELHPGQSGQPGEPEGAQKQLPPGGGGGGFGKPGGGGGFGNTPGGKEGQVPAPKPLKLPKFPISGSRYTAKKVAQMPVNQLADLVGTGQLPPPHKLLRDMKAQEPNILEDMTEEVRQFFEDAMEQLQEDSEDKPIPPRLLKKWTEEQRKKFRGQNKRTSDMSEWLQKRGQRMGKPGGGSAKGGLVEPGMRLPGGKPGNINPVRKG